MKKFFTLTFFFLFLISLSAQQINEFHYDDNGQDNGEFVEVFFPNPQPGDLSTYSVYLYNGNNGADYGDEPLSSMLQTCDAAVAGCFYVWNLPQNGIQNGDPDGIALVGPSGVIDTLAYGGSFVATSGPANGLTFSDIGVSESNSTQEGTSIQLTISGGIWEAGLPETPGAVNLNALPATLTSFTAKSAGTTVAISWSTSSEDGNNYFAVEQSRNGKEFKEIGQVAGAGWSTLSQEYNFIHENVQPGTQYYRLRQVDFDGDYEYSPVVSVEVNSNGAAFLVYPTIAHNEVNIDIPENTGSDATIQIFDANGQVVYSELVGGKGTVTINVNEFTPGAYFIRFWNGSQYGNGRFFRF